MKGFKLSIWKRVSGAGVLALMLPGLALGAFGVCPPHSETFGPDDPPGQILAYIAEINLRPGGGTLIFEPGEYTGLGESIAITGQVCMTSAVSDSQAVLIGSELVVETGGMLTLREMRIDRMSVAYGSVVFVEDGSFVEIANKGHAYLQQVDGVMIENSGVLSVARAGLSGRCEGGETAPALANNGYANLDRVESGPISNEGVIAASGLTANHCFDCYDCSWDPGSQSCNMVGAFENVGVADLSLSVFVGAVIGEWCGTSGPCDCGSPACEYSDGVFNDLGYNLASDGSCGGLDVDETMASEGPLYRGSPAIDIAPIDQCAPVDRFGNPRTDGNNDGVVACDAGAVEYGYASLPVTVRTTPYWRSVGTLDLSRQVALFVSVFSTADFDATDILIDTVDVEGLDEYALRGPALIDANRDGYLDIAVWYRLDRMDPLACGSYDQRFEAMTGDGRVVAGQLRYDVVGCSP